MDQKIALILANPEIGSLTLYGARKVVLTRHNKIYYRVKGKKVILINIFETKQNPNKNHYEP